MILKMLEKYEHDLKNRKRKQYWYRSMYKKCSQCNIYKHHTWIELVSTCLCHKLFKALSNTYIPEHPFKDCRQSYVSEPWYSGWEFFLKEDTQLPRESKLSSFHLDFSFNSTSYICLLFYCLVTFGFLWHKFCFKKIHWSDNSLLQVKSSNLKNLCITLLF